jgi:hypothetical protein
MALEGFEVAGASIRAVTESFRLFPEIGLRPFTKRGIGTVGPDGRLVIDPATWHSMAAWVGAFHEIANVVGPQKVYEVGKLIPKTVVFPANIRDVLGALDSIDVAYHMNHRKNGEVMFNPATGKMLEGIGHVRCLAAGRSGGRVAIEADDPYPCDFNRGIIVAMAARFEPNAIIEHTTDVGCRKQGSLACRYLVSW